MTPFSLPIVQQPAPARWLGRLLLLLALFGGAALAGQAQTITSFSPTAGTVGTPVTIQGTGFLSGGVEVIFGAITNNYNGNTVNSYNGGGNSITVNVPSGAASGSITLSFSNGTRVTSSNSFAFTPPPASITSFSPTSGAPGTQVTINLTNFPTFSGLDVLFGSGLSATFAYLTSSSGSIKVTVPANATTGPITVSVPPFGSPSATSSGTFTVIAPPDLTINTGTLAAPTSIPAGTYGTIIVQNGGVARLAGNVAVATAVNVQNGGTLYDGCAVISGAGTFTLAAGGTLGICNVDGIGSSGTTGAVQVTGTRSFSSEATYLYNGTAAQATGTGLPATVRSLTLNNAQGATLGADLTVTTALTLTTGVLTTGSRAATLGSTATLAESAGGYVKGTVQTTRSLSAAGSATTFGGLGLTLTPAGSTLPGSTLVRRTTGAALRGAGSSQSVFRSFDIQPTVRTGLNVALALTVRDDERNGIAPADLLLFKSENGGTTWQLQRAATVAGAAASGNQPATYTASLSGISSFSVWTLGSAANPLPVELRTFTAEAAGPGAVRLAWATASEKNSARFEVERSLDGAAFAKIGEVSAAGSSTAARTYSYPDAAAPAGLVYYRLRQVDYDGTASYSPVRPVRLGATAALALTPNPAQARTLASGLAPDAAVDVFDALGRPVLHTQADAAGTAPLALPAGLAPGVYVVRSGARTARLVLE